MIKKYTNQYTVAGSEPRRSSTSKLLLLVSHTRIRVPFWEAVATLVPCWFNAKQPNSFLWADIHTGAVDIPISVLVKSYSKEKLLTYVICQIHTYKYDRWIWNLPINAHFQLYVPERQVFAFLQRPKDWLHKDLLDFPLFPVKIIFVLGWEMRTHESVSVRLL